MQPGPWLKEEEGREGARELEWTMAHLTDGLGEERDGRRGLVGEEQSAVVGALADDVLW